jgi:hypothetical protein
MPGEENNNASETTIEENAPSTAPEIVEAPQETEQAKEAAAEENPKAAE